MTGFYTADDYEQNKLTQVQILTSLETLNYKQSKRKGCSGDWVELLLC